LSKRHELRRGVRAIQWRILLNSRRKLGRVKPVRVDGRRQDEEVLPLYAVHRQDLRSFSPMRFSGVRTAATHRQKYSV
jgi:hypothetical protein